MGRSVTGAAWGIWCVGASIMGGGVLTPRIYSKNLISIIFCEAVAIYGIIISIIMASSLKEYKGQDPTLIAKNYEAGFRVFGAGIITGENKFFIHFHYYRYIQVYPTYFAVYALVLSGHLLLLLTLQTKNYL